ncbi:MAG: type I glyceraldehyde-3-phosphate dehydrogenase [Deltaproteobacteria bacterium]|nr:MAG: type I glyceraldehyde-3-phosphate dehydrogenase [Deltaproteobacteria bacterium]
MALKVGINGFGRIGRTLFKIIFDRGEDIEVVAINDLGNINDLAHLLKYDSVHGVWNREIEVKGESIFVDGKELKCLSVPNLEQLPWHDLGVQIVFEATGLFRDRASAQKHIDSGAQKVIVTAPGKGLDATFVIGVNDEEYDPRNHHIVSNASCTTNCLAPVVRVLHENFIVERGLMTTVHSYTMDQRLLDALHKDLRRSRAAALSMIPTTTGAAVAVTEVIPELKGRLNGMAIRVPTPNVSLVDFVCQVGKDVTEEEINGALKEASETRLKGILYYSTVPLVSIDYNHSPYSSIVDAALTSVVDKRLVKVLAWYDNEYGYSNRLADLALLMAKHF